MRQHASCGLVFSLVLAKLFTLQCVTFPQRGHVLPGQGHTVADTPDAHSSHLGDSPFTDLSEGIIEYSSRGPVFLMGDFNARTQDHQCALFDFSDPARLPAFTSEETGTTRHSEDSGPDNTGYGRHLLELGSRHHLVIYNGMSQWPTSGRYTCFPSAGGSSTVDYVLGSREGISLLSRFLTPPPPIGADHTYLALTFQSTSHTPPPPILLPRTIFHFTHDLADIYDSTIHDEIIDTDPILPLSTLTYILSHTLLTAATQSFPNHSTPTTQTRTGTTPQNRWYDEECRQLSRQLRAQLVRHTISRREANRQMHSLTRRKKRAYEERQYWDLYHLFMSIDSATAWRRIRDPRPPPRSLIHTLGTPMHKSYMIFHTRPLPPAPHSLHPLHLLSSLHTWSHRPLKISSTVEHPTTLDYRVSTSYMLPPHSLHS